MMNLEAPERPQTERETIQTVMERQDNRNIFNKRIKYVSIG